MNHAAFDGYTCGLGDVLPAATDDEPSRHGAGEWRLKSSTSPAGQIGNYRFPPNAEIQTETQPDSRAICTHQPPVREPRAFDAMMTIIKLPSYRCIFLAVPGAKQAASWVNEWSTCV